MPERCPAKNNSIPHASLGQRDMKSGSALMFISREPKARQMGNTIILSCSHFGANIGLQLVKYSGV